MATKVIFDVDTVKQYGTTTYNKVDVKGREILKRVDTDFDRPCN